MAKPEVKCSVSDCHYWKEGNNCAADLIMIEIDKHANAQFKEEYAGESFSSGHKDAAGEAAKTCCHTFRPKRA